MASIEGVNPEQRIELRVMTKADTKVPALIGQRGVFATRRLKPGTRLPHYTGKHSSLHPLSLINFEHLFDRNFSA